MQLLIWTILIVYAAFLLFIFFYSLTQLTLAVSYVRSKKDVEQDSTQPKHWPMVSIQLPIYNEQYVVRRLINSMTVLDYPKDKLEIQILDDSTDETSDIIKEELVKLKNTGLDIKHIRRENRSGYKAGALKEATQSAKGDFIAIFDADFIPKPSFLKDCIPHFIEDKVGMVQSKWGHLNKNYNLLTQLQAFGLDAHFSVEQKGRNYAGHFINFNGTAGIWRKAAIWDSGDWQSDTLTEDLDLSYRAQLGGWKFKYVESHSSPAELPAAINALKTQQYRWNKGAAECAVKNIPKVLSSHVSLNTKLHALFHLLNSFVFVSVLMTGILSLPLLLIKQVFSQYNFIFHIGSFLSVSFLFIGYYYWVSFSTHLKEKQYGFWKFVLSFPLFLSVYMGLSLHNSLAVIEGYIGRKTPFVRTPKFNITEKHHSWKGNIYAAKNLAPTVIFEFVLAVYFLIALVIGALIGDMGLYPFHLMMAFGFGTITLFGILQARE